MPSIAQYTEIARITLVEFRMDYSTGVVRWFLPMSPIEPANPTLAAVLRQFREDHGLVQEDLAYQAGIRVSTLSRIELGQNNPSWTTVERIIDALGVDIEQLARAVKDAQGGSKK